MANSNKKVVKKYYSLKSILEHKADVNIIYGEKSNGKSYAVKKHIVEAALNGAGNFVYMRRYDFNIRTADVSSWLQDCPIAELTKGEWNTFSVKSKRIYLAYFDDVECEITKIGKEIGRAVNVSGYQHWASQNFGKIANIVFEEFMTTGSYVTDDEPGEVLKLVSTIARDQKCTLWLIGNTVSRVNPYIESWGLANMRKQQIGTIDDYFFHRWDAVLQTEVETKIAVEYCENAGSTQALAFGDTAKMIAGGRWDTKEMPHLPRPKEEYDLIYEVLLQDCGFSFVLQLLVNEDGGTIVFCYPYTKTRHIDRVLTTDFSEDYLTTVSFSAIIKPEMMMRECIRGNKICYSSNLTGMDFEQVIANRKGVL